MEIDGYPVKEWRVNGRHQNYRSLKLYLLENYKVCYWCGVEVVDFIRTEGVEDPPNGATIDHVKSRYVRQPNEISEKVLSCLKCNTKRAVADHKKYGFKPNKGPLIHNHPLGE